MGSTMKAVMVIVGSLTGLWGIKSITMQLRFYSWGTISVCVHCNVTKCKSMKNYGCLFSYVFPEEICSVVFVSKLLLHGEYDDACLGSSRRGMVPLVSAQLIR